MNIKNKVYITATSSISCAGNSCDRLFSNITQGITGIKTNNAYSYNNSPAIGEISKKQSFSKHIIEQCQNILNNSALESFKDTLLIIGSSVGGMSTTETDYFKNNNYEDIQTSKHNINSISKIINKEFDFYDDVTFSTACTSSANAIGYALEVLQKDIYKNVLVIGVDSLSKTTVGGFLSLGVLSSNPCKPFNIDRDGMNVAEAIACLLLEKKPNKNSIEVCGVGYSSDAHHMTQPHPDGSKTAMLNALKSANITYDKIDYINTHGTGTPANDKAEAHSISQIFFNKPYVSSTKSITGHTLGASGALEAIISCKVLQNQIIPQNTFLDEIENSDINFIQKTTKATVNYVLSNSFAFGGNNCSLIFGKVL